jgi:hypothetical protein
MIFISFFVETNLAPQRSLYIIVQPVYEKPGANCKINEQIYIYKVAYYLYIHMFKKYKKSPQK